MVWEFTCVNTIAESYLKETSIHPCAAAEKAEKLKKAKYKQLERDYYLVPIAVETFGGWGAEGAALIKSISKIIQEKTGEKRSTFFLFQSISLAVQQGNATSVLGTARPGEKLDEIYYL